jgi:phage antirepressor YoqD-like protein
MRFGWRSLAIKNGGEEMDSQIEELVKVEVDRRLSDPAYLRNAVARLSEALQNREKELESLAPIKDFYNAVTESDDWMEMAAAVKVLAYKGWGRNKVFELLRDRQILRYNNEPYQQYVERGYFKTIEQTFETTYGETMINRKTMISQRGLDFIRKLIVEAA